MPTNSPRCECAEIAPLPTNDVLLNDEPWTNRRASERAIRANRVRWQSGRRRFVDPATSEHDYTQAELEFIFAMDSYKQRSGRKFPTWREALEVLKSLGYEKRKPTA